MSTQSRLTSILRRVPAPWFLGMTFLLTSCQANMPGDEEENAVGAAVVSVLESQEEDWNRGDLDAFMSGYWKSERLTFVSGATLHQGWDSTRERYIKRYKSEGKEMGTLRFDELKVRPIGVAAASVHGKYRLQFSDGGTSEGRFTLLLEKMEGAWKIVHDHTSSAG